MPDDWGIPIPWYFWSVSALCEILNDRLANQETVGMTTTFTKFQRALWPKKIGWNNKVFGYIYTKIQFIFRIFYHRCREYLKSSANFANVLGESSSRILAERAFHLNSEWNFAILLHWLIISPSNHRGGGTTIIELLLNVIEHYFPF